MCCNRKRLRGGFSLVEIMIVVVIIGLLAGIVTVSVTGYMEKAKRNKARSDLSVLAGAVDAFYLDKGRRPDNQEGLKVLAPQFVKVVPNDPWGRPYVYVTPGDGQRPFKIVCLGADGKAGGMGADADVTDADVEGK